MRDSEHDANLYMTPLPASLRSARAVIEAGYLWRREQNERFERRREYGAKAVGMLEALLHMGELRECYREQAREIIREWER